MANFKVILTNGLKQIFGIILDMKIRFFNRGRDRCLQTVQSYDWMP